MIDLTPSEEAILRMLIRGYTCAAASEKRGIKPKTGQRHMENARKKNECETNLQLAAEYIFWKSNQTRATPTMASSRTTTPREWTPATAGNSWRESFKQPKEVRS